METPPERARTKPVGRAEPGQTMRDRAVRRSVLDVWQASHATGATPAARRMERITAPLLQWVVRRRVPSRVRRERCIASKQWLQSQLTSRRPLHASREQMLTDGAWFPASTARKDRHGPRRKTAHPATAEPASAAFGPDRLLLAVICLGAALTGFSRNQEKRPDPTMTGVEAPLERAAQG